MKQDSIVVRSNPSLAFMDSGFYEFIIECKLYRPTNFLFMSRLKGGHFFILKNKKKLCIFSMLSGMANN